MVLKFTGGCLCGSVRIEASGRPCRVGLCHCLDCRKHHGALFSASAIFPRDAVTVEGETRDYAGRHFCPRCGSSVFARTADEVEVSLGSLDAPDQLMPTYESWVVRRRFRSRRDMSAIATPQVDSTSRPHERGESAATASYNTATVECPMRGAA